MRRLADDVLSVEEVKDMYDAGLSMKQIGEKVGFCAKAIFHFMKRHGIKSRNYKEASHKITICHDDLEKTYGAGNSIAISANMLGVSRTTIRRRMKEFSMAARPVNKGGVIRKGYWEISNRCSSRKDGYIKIHRLVMEQHIGRKLRWYGSDDERSEVVHHINGDKTDNRIENLMIVSPSEHSRLHWDKYHNTGKW